MISDRSGSITVESVKEGLQVYDNPAEVLTNNPPFDYQMTNLSNYLNLTPWSQGKPLFLPAGPHHLL